MSVTRQPSLERLMEDIDCRAVRGGTCTVWPKARRRPRCEERVVGPEGEPLGTPQMLDFLSFIDHQ
jgi:hypothetical protein